MLIATNSLPSKTKHLGTAIAATETRYAAPIKVGINAIAVVTGHAVLGSPTNGTISIVLENIDIINSVDLLNIRLTIASNSSALKVGEFYWDWGTQILTINPGFNASGLTITYTGIPITAQAYTTEITLPSLFKNWRITGTPSFKAGFGSHPSGSFQINAYPDEAIAIKTAWSPGTPLTINGIGYRVSGLNETIHQPFGERTFTVNLQGYWERWGDSLRSPLDKPIRVRSLIQDNDCSGFSYTAAQLGSVVGVGISGFNFTVRVSREVSDNETITMRSLLEDSGRLLSMGCYVRWESPSGPEIVRWDGPTIHSIASWEVADLGKNGYPELSFNYQGMGASFNGVKLSAELFQANLQLDQDPWGGTQGDKQETLVSGDKDPENVPQTWKGWYYEDFDPENLKSLSWCFDVNDKTKKRITKKQLNGTDLEEKEEVFGFVYTSDDVFTYQDNNGNTEYVLKSLADIHPENYWQLVKETTTKYEYDEKEGYFLKKSITGKQLMRALKETDDGKEAIALTVEINQESGETQAQLIKQREGYTNFFWHPITGIEDHELEDLSKDYEDLKKQDPNQKDYVVPRYSKFKNTEENSFLSLADPRSTADNHLPDIIIGKNSQEQLHTLINSKNPEKYLQWNTVKNQEGTNFNESAGAETLSENAGRPPIQSRLTKSLNCNHGNQSDSTNKPKIKYLASTPGALNYGIETQTLSYTSAYDLTTAKLAATTDYQIKNSQVCCTLNLPLGRDRYSIKPGDAVIYQGILWRVFGSDRSWKIGNPTNLSSFSLSLGMDIRLSVSVEQIS